MIERKLKSVLESKIGSGKAIVLLGPRQTGKTTLIKQLLKGRGEYLLLDCDDPLVRSQLTNVNTEELKRIIGKNKCVFIDEAQRVENVGLSIKILTDQFEDLQIFVSGSSSLDIRSEINEPLTGRKWEYILYPISWNELVANQGYLSSLQQLKSRIIFGMYPDIINNPGSEEEILNQLSSSYLYKDILVYGGIRKPELLEKLLRALALQLGNEVSYNELSNLLQVDKKTVETYINLLEKAFVVFRLSAFSRNLRTEISKNRKIYFYDNGIRNALIANFNPPELRQDIGALWENFLLCERKKFLDYHRISANIYFWRTVRQQEIDYIEEKAGKIWAYEFKWNPNAKKRFPKPFMNTYQAEARIVHRENFQEFLTETNPAQPV